MKSLLVRDWMTSNVITVQDDTTLPEAHRIMQERDVRRLPVTQNGRLVGIVTRSDIRGAQPSEATSLSVWELNYLLANLKVREIMSTDLKTLAPDDTIKDAAIKMHEHKIGALPVVDPSGKLVGILTESDIFRILIAWFNEEIEQAQ